MQNKQKGASSGGDSVKGLDLALKNIELKEEIRALKERQNTLLRESLQHQYMRHRVQIEAERILQRQKEELVRLTAQTEESLLAIKKASLPVPLPDTGPQTFRENPPGKMQGKRPIKKQSRINFI